MKSVFSIEEYAKTARAAVAEGIVMLKNEGNVLPLAKGTKISLFGRSQFNYYKSGTGSGGMVNTAYVIGIKEALEADERFVLNKNLMGIYEEWLTTHPFDVGMGWAQEPWFQAEMPITEEIAKQANKESDIAIVILGRTAGEDKDNLAAEGSYLLTAAEEQMLENVTKIFEKTIVLLNVGNIIDMKWVEKYNPDAVLYVWQGGQEGGNGVADVLSGEVTPSGKLSDTIAYNIEDYPSTAYYGDKIKNLYAEDIYVGYRYFETFAPDRVMYPFGFGLSYTEFAIGNLRCEGTAAEGVTILATVENTGNIKGKEVVQVYVSAPQGCLGKPAKVLAGYAKTAVLNPGEKETVTIFIPACRYASYDDSGVSGNKSCYVLEAGAYDFLVGNSIREVSKAATLNLSETVVLERLEESLAPVVAFDVLKPGAEKADGTYEKTWVAVSNRTIDPMKKRAERKPAEYTFTGDKGYKLADVADGKVSMEDFVAQLSDEELCCIVRGEGMCSPKVTAGTAGAFGGVTERLRYFGIPTGCCADGPSGIRMDCGTIAFAMPNGTCLACSFNEELVGDLYRWEGLELRKDKVDTLLGPGINLHRNPLNGRNFEYFSEDPLLTGRMAAVQLLAMQENSVTGTIKHFACNNQEYSRNFANAVVSERAARELYLKCFEIPVREGQARSIMSSYGPVNGLWTAGNYDLLTSILRREWGFDGIVMTDWWAKANDEGGKASFQNTAAMVRAQNDLYMCTADSLNNSNEDNSMEKLADGSVSRGEYQRTAMNICRFLMQSPAFLRIAGRTTELDAELQKIAEKENAVTGAMYKYEMFESVDIDEKGIDTAKGKSTTLEVTVKDRGLFRLEFECRATAGSLDLAQIPVSVFADKKLIETVSLAGSQKEWIKKEIHFPDPLFSYTFFIKLYFGLSGMELRNVKVVMDENLEEISRQKMKQRREDEPGNA